MIESGNLSNQCQCIAGTIGYAVEVLTLDAQRLRRASCLAQPVHCGTFQDPRLVGVIEDNIDD